uniref:FOXP-CC domain-containing protein n=1 Tax=Haemonchus placei TaxID=6290 RepID=A0A158QPF3_HAEPC
MSSDSLKALLAEDSSVPVTSSMLSEAQRPPADPSGATENLLMLAIQERLQNQFRSNSNQAAANLFNHQMNLNQSWASQDVNRLFQQMLPLLGLPPLLPGLPGPLDLGCLPGTSMTHPLWQHNLCAWPECNHPCENLAVFLNHLSQAHTFNERSTSDMRVQVELVDSLEHRLTKERNRLQAMMQHLHMKQSPDTTTPALGKVEQHSSPLRSPKQEVSSFSTISSLSSTQTQPVCGIPDFCLLSSLSFIKFFCIFIMPAVVFCYLLSPGRDVFTSLDVFGLLFVH